MKSCSSCHVFKPLAEFDHDRHSRDGKHHRCKLCDRKRDRQRIADGRLAEAGKRWLERNPAAAKAHRILRAAVRRGEVKRQSCSLCGGLGSHAHHEDYTRPLDVTWLCRWHHHERHRLERKYGAGQMVFKFMQEGAP